MFMLTHSQIAEASRTRSAGLCSCRSHTFRVASAFDRTDTKPRRQNRHGSGAVTDTWSSSHHCCNEPSGEIRKTGGHLPAESDFGRFSRIGRGMASHGGIVARDGPIAAAHCSAQCSANRYCKYRDDVFWRQIAQCSRVMSEQFEEYRRMADYCADMSRLAHSVE